jgi:uncharacterized protein YjbJ (UPF0337 family)
MKAAAPCFHSCGPPWNFHFNLDLVQSSWHCAGAKETCAMDWDRVEGNWKQLTGKVKEKWGKLTDDDLTAIGGKREQLEGKIQERYGYAKDQARREVDDWYNSQSW